LKTTTSAALAVRAAEAGRRVVVLTIDPARRLATALGIGGVIAWAAMRISHVYGRPVLPPDVRPERPGDAATGRNLPELCREHFPKPVSRALWVQAELVAGLFAALLVRERVGAHEDFFDLGGHSLLATQLSSRVRSLFGVELPLAEIFERPTPAALAEPVARSRKRKRPSMRSRRATPITIRPLLKMLKPVSCEIAAVIVSSPGKPAYPVMIEFGVNGWPSWIRSEVCLQVASSSWRVNPFGL